MMTAELLEKLEQIARKIKNNNLKSISKSILYDYVPLNNFNNQKKGFSIPLDYLIRNELKDFCYDNINSNKNNLKNIINLNYINETLNIHFNNKGNFGVACYDYSKEFGKTDNLKVFIDTAEFLKWLNTKAYK